MKQIVKGYIAGIIDGEGYIGIINQGREPRVIVTSTNEILPRALVKMTRVGYAAVCKRRPDGRRLTAWQWLCLGENAIRVLRQVHDSLIIKRGQAEFVLEFDNYLKARPRPDANLNKSDAAVGLSYAERIRALNSRQRNKRAFAPMEDGEYDLWKMF